MDVSHRIGRSRSNVRDGKSLHCTQRVQQEGRLDDRNEALRLLHPPDHYSKQRIGPWASSGAKGQRRTVCGIPSTPAL